jgi:hypothetical protein
VRYLAATLELGIPGERDVGVGYLRPFGGGHQRRALDVFEIKYHRRRYDKGLAGRAAKSSHDPHGLAEDTVTDATVNPVSRHDVHFDAKPSGELPPNSRKVDQIEIGVRIVIHDQIDVARALSLRASNRAKHVKRGDAAGTQGAPVGLE